MARGAPATGRKLRHRPWATRKPRFWPVRKPGDLVEIDTKQIRPARNALVHHFSARDVVSRWDVVEAHAQSTARTAVQFLDALLARMPFPIALCRSTAAVSSPPSLKNPASNASSSVCASPRLPQTFWPR
jgi:hypothetical protein